MGRTTLKFAPWGAGPHLIHGSLGLSSHSLKRHLDPFIRFFRAQERDQQTDTQTVHATPSVAIGRI